MTNTASNRKTDTTRKPRPNHQPVAVHETVQQQLARALVDGWLRWGQYHRQGYADMLGEIAEKVFDDEHFVAENTAPPSKPATVPPPDNLPPLAELEKQLRQIYYIYNNVEKKQEGLKLFGKLQRGLGQWADWQAQQVAACSKSETQTNVNRAPQGAQQGN